MRTKPATTRWTATVDEEAWVLRAQRGEPPALSYLFEQYFERVFRYASARLRDPSEAEDLTQEVFERMLQSIQRYQPRGLPFASWLFRIAHNLVVDRARRLGSAERATQRVSLVEFQDSPEGEILARLEIAELRLLMQRLSEAQRQVLELRFAAQLNVAETAQVMNRSVDAVKSLQYAGLRAMRELVVVNERKNGVAPR